MFISCPSLWPCVHCVWKMYSRRNGQQCRPWSDCSWSGSALFAHTYLSQNVGFLQYLFEPTHEILALFVHRKFILQIRMRSHPVGLDVWFLVWPFVYFHSSCVRTAKALARLRGCAGSPEPSLVAYAISTKISWASSFNVVIKWASSRENLSSGFSTR